MYGSLVHLGRGMSIFTAGIAGSLGRAGPLFHEVSVIVVE